MKDRSTLRVIVQINPWYTYNVALYIHIRVPVYLDSGIPDSKYPINVSTHTIILVYISCV